MKSAIIISVLLATVLSDTAGAEGPTGYFEGGEVLIVSSSHQDTAWMDTPEACRIFRVEKNILPALTMMRKDPNYTFCMESALHLMEFLEAHPERRDEVIQRMKEGRLEFGATYNQPYESWLSGEELVRQTYFGRRWIRKNLPGCDAKVAFNPDPPARSLQMQQILAKAGIPYLFVSRYHEGVYRWLSPDGSGTLLYTPGHYGNHQGFLHGNPADCLARISGKLKEQSPYYEKRQIPPALMLLNSQDFAEPVSFSPLIEAWNTQSPVSPGGQRSTMRYSSIRGFFEAIDKPEAKFDTRMGERPDVWVYITGPTHHLTSSLRREAARLLPAAETFTTAACLLKGDFADWPTQRLDQAWMELLYMDHGIGGHNGHITDEVFYRKVESARNAGRSILDQALGSIASQIRVKPRRGTPVVVFNGLSWSRSGPVELALPETMAGPVHVVDAKGVEVACQLTALGNPEEINVAAASAGAKAYASSSAGTDYSPENAINGKWAVSDPDPQLGASDRWCSSMDQAGPHSLTVDFGQTRTIHKVVLRHFGVVGKFGSETQYNTVDFQVQGADSMDGPWTDLVAPVVGNTASLTVHEFAPKAMRYLRLHVTRGAQQAAWATIFEMQAFAKAEVNADKLLFIAEAVPAMGYKTYYLAPGAPRRPAEAVTGTENAFHRVELAPGGIKSIFDKKQNRELLDTGKFLGGEVFTMLSVAENNRGRGTDAGEFGRVPLPVMDASFDRVAAHKPEWKRLESGPVRTVYGLEQPMGHATVRQRMVMWHQLGRLDCEVDLKEFSGELWREFRMALPLALDKPQVAYEVPMGVVEIGRDEIPTTGGHAYGDLVYDQLCRDIKPRVVQNFVDASDAGGGLTMSTSVSVFDWQDPTEEANTSTVLQPVLLASRKSCNGSGVWYPQSGDHGFRFSLTTHEGGWRKGRKSGIEANHDLFTVVGAPKAGKATLPAELSFFSVSADHAVISAIKKCEDDTSVVARVYDMEGKDSRIQVKLFKRVNRAMKASIIEDAGAPLEVKKGVVELFLGHHAIETVKMEL
jgi:alpha-mannosidase